MGHCLSCFKVPPPLSAPQNASSDPNKEDMLELESLCEEQTSSHAPTRPSRRDSNAIDLYSLSHTNGNATALSGKQAAGFSTSARPAVTSVANNSSCVVRSFCSRKPASRSAPTMGQADSKQPSDAKLDLLFDGYKDPNEDTILTEGIERLCEDLRVSPDEFRVLVLAWKLNAEQMCRFTREEFVRGCKAMRTDSIKSMQTRLTELVEEVEADQEQFKDLYRFTFRFGLDVAAGQRILPSDMAICLWRLVFSIREPPILRRWLRFLDAHPQVRGIPRDTWNMFLNFSEAVGNDLNSYDDTEAWPSLFDDFVEYENDQMNQNVSKDKEREDKNVIKSGD